MANRPVEAKSESDRVANPTLQQQAAAVERAAVNWRGHVNNLRDLAERGKRPEAEYEMAVAWAPDLEAAAVTLRAIANGQ